MLHVTLQGEVSYVSFETNKKEKEDLSRILQNVHLISQGYTIDVIQLRREKRLTIENYRKRF